MYAGSYRSGDESNIFFSNEVLNQGKWFGANKYTGLYYTKIARAEDIPRVTAAIDKMFENSDAPTKTMTEKQFQLQFMEMMGNVKGLIHGISLIILFAVTLIVANTVAMSARERVTEISVMRTLGFPPVAHPRLHPLGVGPDVAPRRPRRRGPREVPVHPGNGEGDGDVARWRRS